MILTMTIDRFASKNTYSTQSYDATDIVVQLKLVSIELLDEDSWAQKPMYVIFIFFDSNIRKIWSITRMNK